MGIDGVLTIKGTETRHDDPEPATASSTPASSDEEWEMASETAPKAASAKAKAPAPARRPGSSFERTVRLPRNASNDASEVRASYVDGLLTVEVPKLAPSNANKVAIQ